MLYEVITKGNQVTTSPLLAGRRRCFGFLFAFLAFFVFPLFLPRAGFAELPKKSFPVPGTGSEEPERKVTLPASEEEIDRA